MDAGDVDLRAVYDELHEKVGSSEVPPQEQVDLIVRWSKEIVPRLMRGKIKGKVHRDFIESTIQVFMSYITFVEIWILLTGVVGVYEGSLRRTAEAWTKLACHIGAMDVRK
jgi:hypothetical protein